MHFLKRLNLQLFAEEGTPSAGAAAETGVGAESTAAVAGQNLESLGVPAEKAQRYRDYRAKKPVEKPVQQAAAAPATQNDTKPGRMTWDEIVADPEYNKEMQKLISNRLKKSNGAEDTLKKLTPALETLGAFHGIDVSDLTKLDADALTKAVTEDSRYYEDKAAELGVDPQTAMKLDNLERQNKRFERQQQITIEQQKIDQHIMRLHEQGEALKKTFPGFDLKTELQNDRFRRMVSPEGGLTVEDAYYALHHNEIQQAREQAVAKQAADAMAASIRAGQQRPQENGGQRQAASTQQILYSQMNAEQRKAYKEQLIASSGKSGR